jgi:hypothetical protein
MMKKNFIHCVLAILFFSAGFTAVQPVKKIRGYKQASIPGIIPSFEDNERLKQTARKQQYNYWFYLEFSKTEIIKPDGLWIGELKYDLKVEEVKELPVKKIILTGAEKNDTVMMVPATKNKVLLVYPAGLVRDTTMHSKYIVNLAATNELVISYRADGRKYFTVLKKLKELPPDARP